VQLNDAGSCHFVVEVVAFASTLAHASEHGQAAVRLGDVVDELKHVNGLAHASAAEQANLTALGERADQVDNLDAGFEQLDRRREFVEFGRILVDGTHFFALDGAAFVNGATQHVHDASKSAFTDRHRDGCARVGHFHAAAQAVGRTHGNGTHHAVAQLLLDFEGEPGFGEIRAGIDELERVVDFWDAVAGELNIHHGADALNDGTVAHV